VLSMLRNPQVFSSASFFASLTGDLSPFAPEAPAMISMDPPSHTRLRKLVNRAFTPRRVASLETHLRAVTQQLLEPMGTGGTCDLVRDLAVPLPVIAIAELLGVPPERRHDFRRWTDAIVRAANGAAVTEEERPEIRQLFVEFRAYFQAAITAYRQTPSDNLLSDLVRAEEEQQTLTGEEILSLAVLLLLGGSETTTNLIGSAVLALLDHPQMLATVRANPALTPNVLEETLRYEAPIQWFPRQAMQEVHIAGTTVPAGTMLMALYGSANHDEGKFPDPERFDILRNPEGHLTFGFGIHFCLGAQLARLEARVALEGLLRRFPHLARTGERITRVESIIARGPKTLPLTVS
ncbi:MAG: cytochrome P450, partial [Candidatus Binatia bacterium]